MPHKDVNTLLGIILVALCVGFALGRYFRTYVFQNRGEALLSRAARRRFRSPDYHLMNTSPFEWATSQPRLITFLFRGLASSSSKPSTTQAGSLGMRNTQFGLRSTSSESSSFEIPSSSTSGMFERCKTCSTSCLPTSFSRQSSLPAKQSSRPKFRRECLVFPDSSSTSRDTQSKLCLSIECSFAWEGSKQHAWPSLKRQTLSMCRGWSADMEVTANS